MQVPNKELVIPIDFEQFALRGCSLRNTEWAIGICVYAGHDTKIMLNSASSRPKFSKIELATNKYMLFGIFFQAAICMLAACYYTWWQNSYA